MTTRHPNSYRYILCDGNGVATIMTMDRRRKRNVVTGQAVIGILDYKNLSDLARYTEAAIIVRFKSYKPFKGLNISYLKAIKRLDSPN